MRKFSTAGALLVALLMMFAPAQAAVVTQVAPQASTAVVAPASTKTTMSLARSSSVQYRGSKTRAKVTATVKRGSKAATGTVVFYDNGKKVATRTLAKGKAIYTLPSTAALGKHTIKAVHTKTKITRSTTVSVKLREKVSLKTSATSWTIGKTAPLITATVAGKKNTGKIKFYVDGKLRSTKSVKLGKATYRVPTKLAAGKHTVRANYVATNSKYAAPAKAPTIAVTAKRAASTPKKYMTRDGMYKVGTDIAAGLYKTAGTPQFCMWERRNRAGNDYEGSIGFGGGTGQQYMQIKSTDKYVTVDYCGSWIKAPSTKNPKSSIPANGVFRVGYDIRPGTYKAQPRKGEYCSWDRSKSATGDYEDWIDSGFGNGPQYVTIKSTDKFFTTSECGTGWVKTN